MEGTSFWEKQPFVTENGTIKWRFIAFSSPRARKETFDFFHKNHNDLFFFKCIVFFFVKISEVTIILSPAVPLLKSRVHQKYKCVENL